MQNYLCRKYVVFTFSVLDQKNPLWVNLVKKIKIVSLIWNLVPRLIWISGIQWWCSLFLLLNINIFLVQIWSKNPKLFVQSEIWYKDQFEYAKFNGGVYFICFRLKIATLFAIVSLSWKSVLRLIRIWRIQ